MEMTNEDRCSFCGKRRDQLANLVAGQKIAGQHVFICNACVTLIAADESTSEPMPPSPSGGWMDRLRRIAVTLPR
jgi:hypothetical protein